MKCGRAPLTTLGSVEDSDSVFLTTTAEHDAHGGGPETRGFVVPRAGAGHLSLLLRAIISEESGAVVVPCPVNDFLAVRAVAVYLEHFALAPHDAPLAEWLPRPVYDVDKSVSLLSTFEASFVTVVFGLSDDRPEGCFKDNAFSPYHRLAAATARVAAWFQVAPLGIIAVLSLISDHPHISSGASYIRRLSDDIDAATNSCDPYRALGGIDADWTKLDHDGVASPDRGPAPMIVRRESSLALDGLPWLQDTYGTLHAVPTPPLRFIIGRDVTALDDVVSLINTCASGSSVEWHVPITTWEGLARLAQVSKGVYGAFNLRCFSTAALRGSPSEEHSGALAEPMPGLTLDLSRADDVLFSCISTRVERLIAPEATMHLTRFRGRIDVVDLRRAVCVTNVPRACFRDFTGSSVLLPPSLESIQPHAFEDCTAEVDLSCCTNFRAVLSSGFRAYDCPRCELVFPQTLEVLQAGCFGRCTSSIDMSRCNKLDLGSESGVFGGFMGPALRLPASLPQFTGNSTFEFASASIDLSSLTQLTTLPRKTFNAYRGQSLRLPSSLRTLGTEVFVFCTTAVDLSQCHGLTALPKHSFKGFKGATLALPDTIASIGESCFEDCQSSVDLSANTSLRVLPKQAFISFSGPALLLPPTIDAVGIKTFAKCSASVDLSNCTQLRSIPVVCFMGFTGQTLHIPSSAVDVDQHAFRDCSVAVQRGT